MLHFKHNSFKICSILCFTLFFQALAAQNNNEVNASAIIQSINNKQDVAFENKTIIGDLDFTQIDSKAKVHSSLYQSVIKSALSFTNCEFKGKVISSNTVKDVNYQAVFMQNLICNNCIFTSKVDFQSATVYGNTSFTGSNFKETALFNSFYSHSKASFFGQIIAEKDFFMQDALFVGSCDFFKSKFKSNISFQGSRFDGTFNFSSAQCEMKADFSKVRCNNNSNFNYTLFNGIARFNQLRCLGIIEFIQVEFKNDAIFTNALFYDICRFNEAKATANFDFTSTLFYRSAPVLDKIEITDPTHFTPGSVLSHDSYILPQLIDK